MLSIAAASGARAAEIVAIDGPQLRDLVGSSSARVVVVNVWATWCVPCREEFPDLLRLRQYFASHQLELVLVSADFERAVGQAERFLAGHGVTFRTYLKHGSDEAFIEALSPEWSGALPATFVFDEGRRLRRLWEGKTSYDELAYEVRAGLGGG